jgi:hypothetical protein
MNTPLKWPACVSGLKTFFSASTSQGLSASLQFFCGLGRTPAMCMQHLTDWTTPAVPLQPLPQPTAFAQAIDAQTFCLGTPTAPALAAALAYAQQIRVPGHVVAVVLVTDGLPAGCGTLADVVKLAKAAAATTPTYVIGVGAATGNLDMIAAGGGTGQALLVPTNNPTQVAMDFQKALDGIRAQAASCSFTVPVAPAGQSIDLGQVNVQVTTGGGTSALGYDHDCTNGAGWRYDDPAHPTQIVLCPQACAAAGGEVQAKVEVVFGCATLIL